MKLESLYIDAFRGAGRAFELPFNRGSRKRITIIYGPNGSGKTTIVDALDVLGNENSSLKDKSLGSVGLAPLVAIARPRKETVIRLKTDEGSWTATLAGKNVAVTPATGCPRLRVLRRRDLSGLLDEAGTKRYERLRKFIDTQVIEDCEETLRKAAKGAKDDFTSATERFEQSERDLRTEWDSLQQPEGDFREWLRSILHDDDGEEKARWRDLYGRLSLAAGALRALLAGMTATHGSVATAREAWSKAEAREKLARASLGDETLADLRAVLAETAVFLQKHPSSSACPVCAQPVTSDALQSRVDGALDQLKELEQAVAALKTAQRDMEKAEAVLKSETDKLVAGVSAFAAAFPPDLRTIFPNVSPALRAELDAPAADKASTLAAALAEHLPDIEQRAAAQRDVLQTELARRESVKRRVKDASDLKKKAKSLEQLAARLAKAQAVVEQERKAYVEGILASIAGEASRIYETIHPGEGLGKITLVLNAARRGSLECTAAVPGMEDDNPAAYYSEAHLDTLGFAVFMAEALRESPQDTILVLDDVISSVDEEHMQRLVQSLYEESRKFAHVILTTHYKPWREKFRMGLLRDSDAELLELQPRPAGGGLAIGSLRRPERERLHALLAASDPDLQSITAKAGVLLEQLLHFLTHTYACPLPCGQHERGWDLGQYLNALSSKLRKALRTQRHDAAGAAAGEPADIGALLTAVQEWCGLRNVLGCHYNKLAEHLPDADALEFGRKVLALAEALVDADGELPARAESGQCWATTGGRLRLFPFSLRDL